MGGGRLFITDYDGTLRRSDGTFSPADLQALRSLRARGVTCAISTGRNLYSFRKSGGDDIPVDYVIFSTGAGIIDTTDRSLIFSRSLDGPATARAARVLLDEDLDFMVHRPVPENHHFEYRSSGAPRGDFTARLEFYRDYATPGDSFDSFGESSQLIAIIDGHDGNDLLERLRLRLTGCTVIRTTSPLDGRSGWVEIFPADVSKGHSAAWLADRLGIAREDTAAVGNDYNDLDLLRWAGAAYVVENAPGDMRSEFSVVPSHDWCGVAAAVRAWLEGGVFRS